MEPKLLIIEDDDAIAELFRLALSDEGYVSERAATPQEALALLDAYGPDGFDIVLSSPFTSAQGDPYVWLARCRARTNAAIVICSGYPAAMYADHRARGFAAFLQEPFDLQELINLVASLSDGRGE